MTTQYTISNDTDTIVVNGELTNYPNVSFGEENEFDFYISGELADDAFNSTGGTTTSTTGLTATGSTGGTATGGGTGFSTARSRYNRLKEYSNYVGYAAVNQTLGSVYFSENATFGRSEAPSLVVQISPGIDVQEARSVWGVITGFDDTTEIFGSQAAVSMTVFVLAEGHEYDDEQAVRDAFETDI